VNLTGSMHGKSRRILIQLGDLISIKRDVLLNGCEYRDIRRDSRVGSVIGRILKGLRRRKMCVHLPQPIGNEDENDNRRDLVDGTLSQFWRFSGFVGFWRFRRHRHFAGDTISKLAWVDSLMRTRGEATASAIEPEAKKRPDMLRLMTHPCVQPTTAIKSGSTGVV
jgi:hypothetical protein